MRIKSRGQDQPSTQSRVADSTPEAGPRLREGGDLGIAIADERGGEAATEARADWPADFLCESKERGEHDGMSEYCDAVDETDHAGRAVGGCGVVL